MRFIILVLLFVSFTSLAQKRTKTVKRYLYYDVTKKDTYGLGCLVYVSKHDSLGRMIEFTKYSEDSKLDCSNDTSDYIEKKHITYLDANSTFYKKEENKAKHVNCTIIKKKFDQQEIVVENCGEKADTILSIYDDKGRLVRKINTADDYAFSKEYEYDKKNRISKIYSMPDQLYKKRTHKFKYDKNGYVEITKMIDKNNIKAVQKDYYNSDKQRQKTTYKRRRYSSTTIYKYDDSNRLISLIHQTQKKPYKKTVYSYLYNDEGDLLKEYRDLNLVYYFEYEYWKN